MADDPVQAARDALDNVIFTMDAAGIDRAIDALIAAVRAEHQRLSVAVLELAVEQARGQIGFIDPDLYARMEADLTTLRRR